MKWILLMFMCSESWAVPPLPQPVSSYIQQMDIVKVSTAIPPSGSFSSNILQSELLGFQLWPIGYGGPWTTVGNDVTLSTPTNSVVVQSTVTIQRLDSNGYSLKTVGSIFSTGGYWQPLTPGDNVFFPGTNFNGLYNTGFGFDELLNNGNTQDNSAFGFFALLDNTSGYDNSAFGFQALMSANANSNSAFGSMALQTLSVGNTNAAFGYSALANLVYGQNNTAVGAQALFDSTSNSSNTAVGFDTLDRLTTGMGGTAVGFESGRLDSSGNPVQTGNYLTLFGYLAQPQATGDNNEIVIGPNTNGAGSNTATIGSGLTDTYLNGNVHISTPILNGVTYDFPLANGAASTVLTNNGSGVLTWVSTGTYGNVTSVTGTLPIISSGGSTPAISLSNTLSNSSYTITQPLLEKSSSTFLQDMTIGTTPNTVGGSSVTINGGTQNIALLIGDSAITKTSIYANGGITALGNILANQSLSIFNGGLSIGSSASIDNSGNASLGTLNISGAGESLVSNGYFSFNSNGMYSDSSDNLTMNGTLSATGATINGIVTFNSLLNNPLADTLADASNWLYYVNGTPFVDNGDQLYYSNNTLFVDSSQNFYFPQTGANSGVYDSGGNAGTTGQVLTAEGATIGAYWESVTNLNAGTTQLYYCSAGVSAGVICRGSGCSCVGGTETALGIYVP